MTSTGRYWARVVVLNVAAALLVAVAFNRITWQTPWHDAVEAFGVAFLFAWCIGPLCAIVVPRLARGVACRLPFPANWILLIVVMLLLGVAGSLLAIGILRAFGFIPTNRLVVAWFLGSLKVTIVATLIFGIFATIMETLRAQLDETTVALRTKERDESEARRLAAEAQLASLESRVNPHFLFNTLNSIASLVHDDPASAERMTAQLAALMRSSLDQQTPLVPLDDELRVARTYLDIERVRFGDRLRFRFDIGPEVGSPLVPRLSIQTLVENSVKYAVSPSRGGASIVVSAARSDGRVRVAVEDDGPGFRSAALVEGHGLALLRDRLERTFGGSASLAIDSHPGCTRVHVEVPAGNLLDPDVPDA